MEDNVLEDDGLIYRMQSPIVKSSMFDPNDGTAPQLQHKRFLPLEHLANVPFHELEHGLEHLLDLKYVSGFGCFDGEG